MKNWMYYVLGTLAVVLVISMLYRKPAHTDYDHQKRTKGTTTVKVDTTFINLGDVKVKSSMRGKYIFRNAGQQKFVIESVLTNCTCTLADYSNQPTQPGRFTTVTLKYDSTRVGPFQSTGIVSSNADSTQIVLVLRGNVYE